MALESNFNKLAQEGTSLSDKDKRKVIILGSGTSKDSMKKFPKRKLISQRITLELIRLAKEEGNTKLEQSYRNTYYCFDKIRTNGNRAFGKYCKNRFCYVCCSNRKGMLINKYYPVLSQWQEPNFLTLTHKSFNKLNLKQGIRKLQSTLSKIIRRCNKRHQRNKGPKIICLATFEANFNPIAQTYNPHFHIITASREIGRILNIEWLREHDKTIARPSAQKLKKVNDLEKDLIEVIKYSTKIFTDPEMKKGKKKTLDPVIYAAAIHEVVKAFKGIRILNTYGFSLPKHETPQIENHIDEHKIKDWTYFPEIRNYIEEATGEVMFKDKHQASSKVEHLLDENIDSELN